MQSTQVEKGAARYLTDLAARLLSAAEGGGLRLGVGWAPG